jgi:hypothetical protein
MPRWGFGGAAPCCFNPSEDLNVETCKEAIVSGVKAPCVREAPNATECKQAIESQTGAALEAVSRDSDAAVTKRRHH